MRVVHAPGTPGTFSPPPTSNETAQPAVLRIWQEAHGTQENIEVDISQQYFDFLFRDRLGKQSNNYLRLNDINNGHLSELVTHFIQIETLVYIPVLNDPNADSTNWITDITN